jgi:hypothetical protein
MDTLFSDPKGLTVPPPARMVDMLPIVRTTANVAAMTPTLLLYFLPQAPLQRLQDRGRRRGGGTVGADDERCEPQCLGSQRQEIAPE